MGGVWEGRGREGGGGISGENVYYNFYFCISTVGRGARGRGRRKKRRGRGVFGEVPPSF